jgi:hypothetical protein
MRRGTNAAVAIGLFLALAVTGAARFAAVDSREIGRTDPKRAAKYRLPWFNFSETYTDGAVLGVVIGSTRAEAIAAAEKAGMEVEPSGWGDNRTGGASLYQRSDLVAHMHRQPYLNFSDPNNLKGGMIIDFRDGRVAAVQLHYISSEVI